MPTCQLISCALALGLATTFLTGCGDGRIPISDAQGGTSSIQGNWLIAGDMPFVNQLRRMSPGIAVTFDVSGTKVNAAATLASGCDGKGTYSAQYVPLPLFNKPVDTPVMQGVINADGSYEIGLTPTLATLGYVLTVSGDKVQRGSLPNGSYTEAEGGITMNGVPCSQPATKPFKATRIADVSGSFSGGGDVFWDPTFSGGPVTFEAKLTQGAMENTEAGQVFSYMVIGGSIRVTGIPCFQTGTADPAYPGYMAGSSLIPRFVMDDGSILSVNADVADNSAMQLVSRSFYVVGGKCAGHHDFMDPTVLSKR